MYLTHFGLTEAPFSITPDTRFLFLSERHRDALAHLLYGISGSGGFVQLTGEVGTGKTTLCRRFLEQAPAHVDVALILNPRLTGAELLAAVCDELRIAYPPAPTAKLLVDALYRHLLDTHARGRRTVLVIDEAQDLAPEVLEDVRLLTNLETAREKLLQIILIGQPELIRMLQREDLRQVAQRITARYHLAPFSERETGAYIRHRLGVAGVKRPVFSEAVMRAVHRLSGGVPRLVNIICDRALLAAYAEDRHEVARRTLRRAAREALAGHLVRQGAIRRRLWLSAAAGAAVIAVGALVTAWPERLPRLAALAAAPARWAGPSAADSPASGRGGPMLASAELSPGPAADATGGPRPDASSDTPGLSTSHRPGALTLAEAFADRSVASDRSAALASLYAVWGLDPDPARGDPGCEHEPPEGFRCLVKTGGWARLRRFDLPAVLELTAPDGERRHAALVALRGEEAILALGERRLAIPLEQIDRAWSGSFIVVWKPPALSGQVLKLGARGDDVVWLRQSLDEAMGHASPAGPGDMFDPALVRRVAEFQRQRALAADGVAGDETLVRLVAELPGSRVPRLDASAAAGSGPGTGPRE